MFRLAIAVARFALSAWVGAAALFVVTGIREVRSTLLDSYTRDVLVGIRFPSYYLFGFSLVGLAALAMLAASWLSPAKRGRPFALAFLTVLALGLMIADYYAIYLPLVEMITPPGESRPAEFLAYHTASKWVNLTSVSLCAIAALVLCAQPIESRTPA
jgi:hypothetical protein